jgi:hypothetical protein
LTTLLSSFSWRDRTLSAFFRKFFDIVMEKFPRDEAMQGGKGAKMPKSRRWLPFVNDIRNSILENSKEIRVMVIGLRRAELLETDFGTKAIEPSNSPR